MEKKSVCIVGSRTINSLELLENIIIFLNIQPIEIISGGAKGVDKLAESFADKYHISKRIFYANWNEFGKRAGYIRNNNIVNYIKNVNGVVIVIWDGKSKGTKMTIELAKKSNVTLYVYILNKGFIKDV